MWLIRQKRTLQRLRSRSRLRPRLGGVQLLEERRVLSAVGFQVSESFVQSSSVPRTHRAIVADIDGDGDLDWVGGESVVWRPNVDGQGTLGEPVIVSTQSSSLSHLIAADVDRDGDVDVLTASNVGKSVAWFENLDGQGRFGPKQEIASSAGEINGLQMADLDDDEAFDLVLLEASDSGMGELSWYEFDEGPNEFVKRSHVSLADVDHVESISAFDIDQDGDMDVLVGNTAWLENVDAQGGLEVRETLVDITSRHAAIADVDGDGRIDLLAHGKWYVAEQGTVDFQWQQDLWFDDLFRAVQLADFDGDSDLDAYFSTTDGNHPFVGQWFQLGDGGYEQKESNGGERVNFAEVYSSGDVNGDGRAELIGVYDWWQFDPSLDAMTIGESFDFAYREVYDHHLADLDGDDDLDLLLLRVDGESCFDFDQFGPCTETLAWAPNLDGAGTFGGEQLISTTNTAFAGRGPATRIFVGDLNGDQHTDVILRNEKQASWFANLDGDGAFSQARTIAGEDHYLAGLSDVDGDGDQDLIRYSDAGIAWQSNLDGAGSFSEAPVTFNSIAADTIQIVDWNHDGQLDIVAYRDSDLLLIEHSSSENHFELATLLARLDVGEEARQSFYPQLVDIDGDEDLDLIHGYFYARADGRTPAIVLKKNLGGELPSVFGDPETLVASDTFRWSPSELVLIDLDSDGDQDLVSWDREMCLYFDHLDGQGNFEAAGAIPAPRASAFGDLDGDGDVDFTSGYGTIWYENRPVGDATGDGTFDSSDLVLVMAAGLYEDDVPRNATFQTGDWNGDGDFDTSDLVLAFQQGRYELQPQQATPSKDRNVLASAIESVFAEQRDDRSRVFVP